MPMSSLSSRIPASSHRLVRWLALAVLITQALISVTGSVVRVTGSGLGCPTWPQCFPGSMVPIEHPEVAQLHQVIEFGNRTLTGLVGFVALACLIAAWQVRPRRPRLVRLALIMPVGVVVQAIIGGITVLVDLSWWSVSIHFMASAVLIWLAACLFKAAGEGDEEPTPVVPGNMRRLLVALTAVTAAMLIAGTLVTAAGPHAGDADTPRLVVAVPTLVQAHGLLVMAYVCLLAVFGVWLRSARPTKALLRAYTAACVLVLAQGALGSAQYLLGVPEAMVVLHVLGSTLVITVTALLWGESRYRGKLPEPSTPTEASPTPTAA
ncbi:COX15/CtaA family protein [Saccharopolyspora gloriosae]|uniref:Cytochrome c oxidase assembly protein subunit 15 n=1 Tax=Saccharopolyspora gloriosae TaxID=455344 RepID=A0A840NE44_9PSEU|nr:cytochrome c oxidase assembly protein subunit 15 [Saccharopolyspora gloriosae]